MKLKIDGCAGCGFCYLLWREWFAPEGNGSEKAIAKDIEIPYEKAGEVRAAMQQCPAGAIKLIK